MGCGCSKPSRNAEVQPAPSSPEEEQRREIHVGAAPVRDDKPVAASEEEEEEERPSDVKSPSREKVPSANGKGEDGRPKRSSVNAEPAKKVGEGDVNVAAALRAKRRGIFVSQAVDVRHDFRKPVIPKEHKDRVAIASALRQNVLFASVGEGERRDLIDAMEPQEVGAGTVVIRQGDEGDHFYVIAHGSFDILVNGTKVATFGDGTSNRSFGELALMYNSPRAASVVATTPAKLWRIGRVTFRNILANTSHQQHVKLKDALRRGILEDLEEHQLDRVAEAATFVSFNAGDQIIRKGEEGEVFYIIERGSVICRNLDGDQANNILYEGDYFGERALLRKAPRAADVFALEDVSLVALYRDDFETLLGDLRGLLEHNLGMRLLLCVPILGALTVEQKQRVFSQLRVASFAPNEHIISEGDFVRNFYILKDGTVAIVRRTGASSASSFPSAGSEGDHQKKRYLRPGEEELLQMRAGQWFGEKEVREGTRAGASVVAVSQVQCFSLDRKTYLDILAPLGEALHEQSLPVKRSYRDLLMEMRNREAAERKEAGDAGGASGAGGGHPNSRAGTPGTPQRPRVASAADVSDPMVGAARGGGKKAQLQLQRRDGEWERLDIPFEELEMQATLGTGTFGRVRLVYHRATDRVFALKILHKSQVVALKQKTNIINEKNILSRINHPFVIRLYNTYKDHEKLYMLQELVQGGELFNRLSSANADGRISIDETRFYAACVLDVFDYIHEKHIIYRDLKPENLLIDDRGFLKMVDFGFAKIVHDRTYTLCGTPEYLAPELVLGRGHNKGVDYWALGILMFEMLVGHSPFADLDRDDQLVIARQILQNEVRFPSFLHDRSVKSVIRGLLEKDLTRRLGMIRGGAKTVKERTFFREVDWGMLQRREMRAPWTPEIHDKLDTSNFDPYDEDDDFPPYVDDGTGWDQDF